LVIHYVILTNFTTFGISTGRHTMARDQEETTDKDNPYLI